MPARRAPLGLLALALIPACDHRPPDTGPTVPTATNRTVPLIATGTNGAAGPGAGTANNATTSGTTLTVGHVRVAIKKVTVGKVPLKAADGSITYADEPRLMVALRIENVNEKQQSGYNTWVPDLDAAKTVAKLTDDRGTELKRITFGFGNNVQGRTVLDTLTPGKVIGDLLVFEAPATEVKTLKLTLPGANCGVKGSFEFEIDATTIARPK
jgi:hypothetical protein